MEHGFLGLGGNFKSDFALVVQILMMVNLGFGTYLARKKKYRAHQIIQTYAVLTSLVFILWVMIPSFVGQIVPQVGRNLNDPYYRVALLHSGAGLVALLPALYIIMSAGTAILPDRFRIQNYRVWMRFTLGLWIVAFSMGLATYYQWYLKPGPVARASPAPAQIGVTNYAFSPAEIEVAAGTTVVWKNEKGRHVVAADDDSFTSPTLKEGESFSYRFNHPGRFPYYCAFHGKKGGHDMAGTVVVK